MHYYPIKKYDHMPSDSYILDYLNEKFNEFSDTFTNLNIWWNCLSNNKKIMLGTAIVSPFVLYLLF